MRFLRCSSVVPFTLVLLVVGCATPENVGVGAPQTVAPRSVTTVKEAERPAPTIPPLLAALEFARKVRMAFPTTTTQLPAPPATYRIAPPVVATNPLCPPPISERRCPELSGLFDSIFGCASEWSQSVAWRESNCRPDARNGSSGSAGLLQLYRHDDILAAVCPELSPSVSWADPRCNLLAGKSLFDGSGTRPWAL